MRAFKRFNSSDKKGDNSCSNCGHDPSTDESPENDKSTENVSKAVDIDETTLKEATGEMVKEVMAIYEPLLEKLGEASQQLKNESNQETAATPEQSFEEQLANMKTTAKSRQQLLEMKINKKLQEMQAKIASKN